MMLQLRRVLAGVAVVAAGVLFVGCGEKDDVPVVESWSGRDRRKVESGEFNPVKSAQRVHDEQQAVRDKSDRAALYERAFAPPKMRLPDMPPLDSMIEARDIKRIRMDINMLTSDTLRSVAAARLYAELGVALLGIGEVDEASSYIGMNVSIVGGNFKQGEDSIEMSEACYRQAYCFLFERKEAIATARAFEAMSYAEANPRLVESNSSVLQKYRNFHALVRDKFEQRETAQLQYQSRFGETAAERDTASRTMRERELAKLAKRKPERVELPVFVSAVAPRTTETITLEITTLTNEATYEGATLHGELTTAWLRLGQTAAARPHAEKTMKILAECKETTIPVIDRTEAQYRMAYVELADGKPEVALPLARQAFETMKANKQMGLKHPVTLKYEKLCDAIRKATIETERQRFAIIAEYGETTASRNEAADKARLLEQQRK